MLCYVYIIYRYSCIVLYCMYINIGSALWDPEQTAQLLLLTARSEQSVRCGCWDRSVGVTSLGIPYVEVYGHLVVYVLVLTPTEYTVRTDSTVDTSTIMRCCAASCAVHQVVFIYSYVFTYRLTDGRTTILLLT